MVSRPRRDSVTRHAGIYMLQALLSIHFIFLNASLLFGNVRDEVIRSTPSSASELDSIRSLAQERSIANPLNPDVQMAYARLINSADSARSIYRKIITNEKAAPALRAEANFRLACLSYMAANYEKAETYSLSACKLEECAAYIRLLDRATMLAGRDSLHAAADSGKKAAVGAEKNEKKTAGAAYYLQIAAFAEMENAQNLKKDLSRLFPNVLVQESSSHGKSIFRIRIGPFAGNKEAQAFGDSALVKNKVSFRLVEE